MQSLWSYFRQKTQFPFYLVTPDHSMVLLHLVYAACAALPSAALAFLLLCAILQLCTAIQSSIPPPP